MDEYVFMPGVLETLIGVFSPFVIALLKKRFTSRRATFLFAVLLSGLCGVIGALIAGVGWSDIPRFATWVMGIAQISYATWKGLIAPPKE